MERPLQLRSSPAPVRVLQLSLELFFPGNSVRELTNLNQLPSEDQAAWTHLCLRQPWSPRRPVKSLQILHFSDRQHIGV